MVYTCENNGPYEFADSKRPWARTENSCSDCYDESGKYYGSKNLDERRKVEVLKHSRARIRMTKKQNYSMAFQRNGVKQANNNRCLKTDYWGLTSACDVPGKVQILRLDRDIPLTRFNKYH